MKNWSTLLCFEILYKIIGVSLMGNITEGLLNAILKTGNVAFISQENIGSVISRPLTIVMLLGGLLIFTYYVYFEIAALLICCEAGWRGEHLTVWALWKQAFLRSLRVFHYKNLPVVLALLPVIGLSVFPLTNSLLKGFRIPEFIMDFIQNNFLMLTVFVLVLTLLNVLLFFTLFSFPAVILKGDHFIGSWRQNARLMKKKKWKTALWLLACILAFLLVAFIGFVMMVLILWGVCRLEAFPAGEKSLFEFYYLKWSAMGAVALSMLGSVALSSTVITLYHDDQGDIQPQPQKKKPTVKSVLRRTVAIAATLAMLAVYSETELGGNIVYPTDGKTEIVAHRAGAVFAPENTLAALREAVAAGADMADIDVPQTRDGALVILHDANLKRTTGLDANIWEVDEKTVRDLDAGTSFSSEFRGEPVPTLMEMLEASQNRIQLMIELKSTGHEHGLVEKTVEQIRSVHMEQSCIIASMDQELLKESKKLAPEIRTVYITALLYSDLYDLDYADGYSVETTSLTSVMLIQAHLEGKKVYAWTANKEKNIKKILRIGADGLVADNPELARYYQDSAGENMLLQLLTDMLYGSS